VSNTETEVIDNLFVPYRLSCARLFSTRATFTFDLPSNEPQAEITNDW